MLKQYCFLMKRVEYMVRTEQLQLFVPFQSLDEHQLILLASNSRLLSVDKGVKLFAP
jgi:hypothetical protein